MKLRDHILFKLTSLWSEAFSCPVCQYSGAFMTFKGAAGSRKNAMCPNCRSLERHRAQYLVLENLLPKMGGDGMRILHFAPEEILSRCLRDKSKNYETADVARDDVDHNIDMTNIPFADGSYDLVFVSRVLEHIQDDIKAVSEVRRILKPNGVAILPVPIVCKTTVEYPEPNPLEDFHVRAPGKDYYDRYTRYFGSVDKITSDDLPKKYQTYIYEDRSCWPSGQCLHRPGMEGDVHVDIIPVCRC